MITSKPKQGNSATSAIMNAFATWGGLLPSGATEARTN